MDDIYRSVLDGAYFVIGAYTLIWVTFIVYLGLAIRRIGRLEQQIGVLESSLERRTEG
jgi:hypothetical protein